MKLFIDNGRVAVLALLLIGASLSTVIVGSHAQDKRLPKPSGHINDFGDVIDAATRQRLEKVLENLEQKTGINFVVATLKAAGNEDLYDYSLRLANDWNIGSPASP